MNCDISKEYMMKHFDGELNEAERVQFREHLEECSECRDEFNCMKAIFTTLDTKAEIEPPDDFEARVMDKVASIENERREKNAKRIVWLYNSAMVLSIVLLLIFVADLKQVSVFSAFEKLGEYFSSFSSAAEAVMGVVKDLFALLGSALMAVIEVSFTIVKSYYYVFIVLLTMVFVIQKLLHYVGTHGGEETE
jgi:predicted anti-sigma-YlaC factor YlaD